MIKALIAGVWAVIMLSGAIFFFGQMAGGNTGDGEMAPIEFEQVKVDSMSITVVRESILQGYVILDASFSLDPEKILNIGAPVEIVLKDALNKSVFTDKDINIHFLERFEFDKFKQKVSSSLNGKFGDGFVEAMHIERIDFISYDEIRANNLRGG